MLNFVKEQLRRFKADQRFRRVEKTWSDLQAQTQVAELSNGKPLRLVVMPSDPWTLVGAKGDEAMIQSVVSQLKEVSPGLEVGILTSSTVASEAARSLGYQALQVWDGGVAAMSAAIRDFRADTMAVLGADCMDGYYNPITTLTMLAVSDLAARSGVRVSLLGFSFNDKPDQRLKEIFDRVNERVAINVRDEISFNRFKAFCRARAQLVADSAFKLRPVSDTPAVNALARWVDGQHAKNSKVIGFNVHPMLLGEPSLDALNNLVDQVARAIEDFLAKNNTALALISHDYRGDIGDDVCLKPLYEKLKNKYAGRIYYDDGRCSAAELKSIAGLVDGVVTGRMHLAIAALGMGVPVAALTYQDKFQGLMKHFDLPQSLLLAPEKLRRPDELFDLLMRFDSGLPELSRKTDEALPKVKAASALNVANLLGQA